MQNTRLNTLVQATTKQVDQLFRNPWRRVSLLTIGLLFGFLVGNILSTTAGQRSELDVVAALLIVVATELTSRVIYGGSEQLKRSLSAEFINMLKIGVIYSLCLEAFKLGS
ncbi:DUF565 domain-containing protein [Myxacorys almedinensis]|uniref:DUF565 domain-containing protein n=1 Tax=Myxacorys almedinensis A TaxID=2690445 RepID=A0A8J7Z797_9CYAN|nr:DUF565 domain-containing protein [Myxacorys almedinensis]NDJ19343.1 DUF565 domain-containing protein [Myxacorys almedinensis A]